MYIARSKAFDKQYKKLSPKLQKQFFDRVKLLLSDERHPLLHVHTLTGKYTDMQSINVTADIRAIFEVRDGDTYYFSAIGSHSELYG